MLDPLVDPDMVQALAHFVEVQLAGMHVSCVARVEKFDPDKQTVDCQPLVQHEFPDEYGDRALETLPVMTAVPVSYQRGAAGGLTFPLSPGDVVTVVATTRSIAKWLRTSGGNDPVDPEVDRHHTLSDGVAYPCVRRLSDAIADFNNDGPELAGAQVVLNSDDVRLGGRDASSKVVVEAALTVFGQAVNTALSNMQPSGSNPNPPGVITMQQLQKALAINPVTGAGWAAGTSNTRAK